MLIRKAYKFRIYPNKTQQTALAIQFGHSRYVYNAMLAERMAVYRDRGETMNYVDTAKRVTILKQTEETEWLREADSQVLQQALRDLDRAYQNFFAKRAGFPRFKARHNKQSIRYPQRVKVELTAKRTYLPKVGWVKTVFHRSIEGTIKNVTVSKTKSGRYFASFQVEVEIVPPVYRGKQVGLDLGLSSFAALSDGRKVDNPRHLIKAQKKLRRLQKRLSRAQKGSVGREKTRFKVARQYERVANQRKDFQHKLSHALVQEHRLTAIEDLHIKGMVRNKRLAKHISDAGWGEFVRQLHYKGDWYGCDVLSVDRRYPSSKTCSTCGAVMEAMPLQIRKWQCPICHTHHDRDVNAAINILKQTTAGAAEWKAGGVRVRPDFFNSGRNVEAGSPPL